MQNDELKYLTVPLPGDILAERMSGHFENEIRMIQFRLSDRSLSRAMRSRLEYELENITVLRKRYTVSPDEAVKMMREIIPDFTAEELETLRIQSRADWIYLNGEIRFIDSFRGTLLETYPEYRRRARRPGENSRLKDECVEKSGTANCLAAHIHIIHSIRIDGEDVREGEPLLVHMPFPHKTAEISDVRLIRSSQKPARLPEEDELQPTVCFRDTAAQGMTFEIEYSLTTTYPVTDMETLDRITDGIALVPPTGTADNYRLSVPGQGIIGYPEKVRPYLAEKLPHIIFSPYLKALSDEICGDEYSPLRRARLIYDFVTTRMEYRFMRDYFAVESIAESAAASLRGDCGVQAILFVALCRISGIPARWQSGLIASPEHVGEHDWAMFWIPEAGWLYTDPSYGNSACSEGNTAQWNFYFGNLDPYRIPINNDMQAELIPEKKFSRIDPIDNQCGEAECESAGIRLNGLHRTYTGVDIRLQD